jgi:glucose 1-dehydrogenase
MNLKGKVAIITGGSSGIGAAIVVELARAGANVVIGYHSHPEAADEVKERATALGVSAVTVQGNVANLDDLRKIFATTVEQFGGVNIMVNNAGIQTRTSLLETTEEQYDKVMAVNLKSAVFGTQFAAQQMIKQGGGGRIINISSVHEDWPMPGNTPYCVSKGGMRMLTRNAALELAKHHITVVGVGPGAVATPINEETLEDPEELKKLKASIPLGRVAEPGEIAQLVTFLAGDGASYLTATTVMVDGGIMQGSAGL